MKIRPAVVLSTELYHRHRPDVIVGLITTQPPKELAPTDCELRDWRQAGLHQPSFFRLFPVTLLQREVRLIGRLPSPIGLRFVRASKRAFVATELPIRVQPWDISAVPDLVALLKITDHDRYRCPYARKPDSR
jgi:hypothetical protein